MSNGINKVILVGHLGNDPDTKYTSAGATVTTLSVATSESWMDKESHQKQERTEWHRITVFGKLAEICDEYLKKGAQVYIEGSLRTDKYTDKDGVEKYSTKIIAKEMRMLGGRQQGGNDEREQAPQEERQSAPTDRAGAVQRAQQAATGAHKYANSGKPVEEPPQPDQGFDPEEIPF